MSSEILKKENSVVTLKLTIDAQSFDKACKDAYNKNYRKDASQMLLDALAIDNNCIII